MPANATVVSASQNCYPIGSDDGGQPAPGEPWVYQCAMPGGLFEPGQTYQETLSVKITAGTGTPGEVRPSYPVVGDVDATNDAAQVTIGGSAA